MRVKIYNKDTKSIYIDKIYTKDEILVKISNYCEKHCFNKFNRIKEYCKKNKINLFKNTFYSKRQLGNIKLLFKKESSILSIIEYILNISDVRTKIFPCFIKNKNIINNKKTRGDLISNKYIEILDSIQGISNFNYIKEELKKLNIIINIVTE